MRRFALIRLYLALALGSTSFPGLALAHPDGDEHANVAVMVEMISVPRETATELLRDGARDGEGEGKGGEGLRKRVEGLLEDGTATLGDCLYLRARKGRRGKLRSVDEVISGSEGDPPEIPHQWTAKGEVDGKFPITDSVYAAYEVRETGTVLEISSSLDRTNREGASPIIVLDPVFTLVVLKGKEYVFSGPREPEPNPMAAKWQPRFHTSTIDHPIRLVAGKTALAGTFNDAENAGNLWLVFFTGWVVP